MTNEIGLGFKQLNADNWLKPDPVSQNFVAVDVQGQPRVMIGDDWIQLILRPQMASTVPTEIKKLYEAARGTMAYGFLFYPVYTLAAEQLFRVAEAAVTFRCQVAGAPSKVKTFDSKLKWLTDSGLISLTDERGWHKVRNLRNISSHPQDQTILPPGWTIDFLEYIAEKINTLFSDSVQPGTKG